MLDPYNEYDREVIRLSEEKGYRMEGSGMDQVYLKQALKSANRSKDASETRNFEDELGESSSAIIFSALSTEAIISEYITHFEFSSSEIPESLISLRESLNPMHKWKTMLKFVKPDINIGSNSRFQKLNCLMDLRNSLVHRQARLLEPNRYPEKLENYMRLKIIEKPKEFRGSWITSMLNYNTAKWAADTAIEWMDWSSEFVSINEADV